MVKLEPTAKRDHPPLSAPQTSPPQGGRGRVGTCRHFIHSSGGHITVGSDRRFDWLTGRLFRLCLLGFLCRPFCFPLRGCGLRRFPRRLIERLEPCLHLGRRLWLGAIAEAFQDLLDVVGIGTEDRHHGRRHQEGAAVECAIGPRAGPGFPGQRRADQIGEPLQNVDAHRAPSEDTEASQLIEGAVEGRVDDHRRPAGGKRVDDIAEAGLFLAVILQRPEQRHQAGGRRA